MAGPTRRSARLRCMRRLVEFATLDDDEREYSEMLGTYGVGGGTTTNAFACSKVVKTRLNAFGEDFIGVSEEQGTSEIWRSFRTRSSEGDAGREDTAVHEELVDETEL